MSRRGQRGEGPREAGETQRHSQTQEETDWEGVEGGQEGIQDVEDFQETGEGTGRAGETPKDTEQLGHTGSQERHWYTETREKERVGQDQKRHRETGRDTHRDRDAGELGEAGEEKKETHRETETLRSRETQRHMCTHTTPSHTPPPPHSAHSLSWFQVLAPDSSEGQLHPSPSLECLPHVVWSWFLFLVTQASEKSSSSNTQV